MLELGPIAKLDSLEELCSTCDVIAIFLPLNDDTRGLISRNLILRMKPSALVINVARGAITDEAALAERLQAGQLGGLGLDVFAQEPIVLPSSTSQGTEGKPHLFQDLVNHPRVVVMPHCGGWTSDCWAVVEREVVARVTEIVLGQPITVKSADPRLQGQENLGCVYPLKNYGTKTEAEFDFERASLKKLLGEQEEVLRKR